MGLLRRIKNAFYAILVERNENIRHEYQSVIDADPSVHKKHRGRSWRRLIKLNIKYRVLRRKPKTRTGLPTAPMSAQAPTEQQAASIPPEIPPTPEPAPSQSEPFVKKLQHEKSESATITAPTVIHYAKGQYKNCSCTAFTALDLLIHTPFSDNKTLFHILSQKHGVVSFASARIAAEDIARKNMLLRQGHPEISIHDIYAVLEEYTGIDAAEGVRAEFELLLSCVRPTEYFYQTYEILSQTGPKMIVIEDTVWPSEYIRKLLNKCGYDNIEEIFASCESKCSKADGSLYMYVKEILYDFNHFNLPLIVVNHDKEAYNAVKTIPNWYPNIFAKPNDIGNARRAHVSNDIIQSVYAGVVNQTLYGKLEEYSLPFECGFIYGGYFALALCHWAEKYAVSENADHVFFMSPESSYLIHTYHHLYPERDVCDLLLPETLFTYALLRHDTLSFALYVTEREKKRQSSVISALMSLGSVELSVLLENYGIKADLRLEAGSIFNDLFSAFLIDHADDIRNNLKKECDICEPYYRELMKGAGKIVIVDTNPEIKAAFALNEIFRKDYMLDVDIKGLILTNFEEGTTAYTAPGSFTRSSIYCDDVYFKYRDNNFQKMLNLLLQGRHKRILGCGDSDGVPRFVFQPQDSRDIWAISQIHEGIVFFAQKFMEYFPDAATDSFLKPDAAFQILRHGGGRNPLLQKWRL